MKSGTRWKRRTRAERRAFKPARRPEVTIIHYWRAAAFGQPPLLISCTIEEWLAAYDIEGPSPEEIAAMQAGDASDFEVHELEIRP